MVRVSVIVPVYNAEKFLTQCLSSLANQTLKDIEIIAINDGSTDSSLDIMQRFADMYKDKIKIIDSPNEGVGAARNKGLDMATGEFIKFVDADDYLSLNILGKMYNLAKENNVSLVRGNFQTLIGPFKMRDTAGWSNIKGSKIIDVKENKDYIVTELPGIGNKLISRKLIGDLKFPEGIKWEDLAIVPVVVASSEKLFHLDEPVYNYRIHLNTTVTDFIKAIPSVLDIIKSLETLEREMTTRVLNKDYEAQIESLYILHTLFRVENAMTWVNFPKSKKEVVINSLINIIALKYPNWRNNDVIKKYSELNPLFKFTMHRLNNYTKNYFQIDDREELEKRIKLSFEHDNAQKRR